jgi:hypothetical protein
VSFFPACPAQQQPCFTGDHKRQYTLPGTLQSMPASWGPAIVLLIFFARCPTPPACSPACLPAGWTFDMADAGRFRNAMGDALYTYREHKDSFRWVGQRAWGWYAAAIRCVACSCRPAGRPTSSELCMHACNAALPAMSCLAYVC